MIKTLLAVVSFTLATAAWSQTIKQVLFNNAVSLAKCVVQDYTCNLTVSAIELEDPEQNVSMLLPRLLARGNINYDAGPSPGDANYVTAAECLFPCKGSKAKILIYNAFYRASFTDAFRAVLLLHEVGHSAGIYLTHIHTQAESDEWNRRISENCMRPELLRYCEARGY